MTFKEFPMTLFFGLYIDFTHLVKPYIKRCLGQGTGQRYNKAMNHIHLLSPKLISQIAAGEVIERPASAVKELVENSLDAGATRITVEIEEGGLKRIRVVDDGSGMGAEDAKLAFSRHATSKIEILEDLNVIQSLGFRGEALASIATVARIVMKTRQKEDRVGTYYEIDGGKDCAWEAHACEVGTDLTIFGLFQHTPARKKFMKSEKTEYGHIFDGLVSMALAHPRTAFRLKKDDATVLELPREQGLKERIRRCFGNETAEALLPLEYQQSNLMINGFVGKPELALRSKRYQFLFVNGRVVENRLLAHAVKEAFHSLLMHEKYPWFLLDLQIDPAFVDINVHPRKLELQFVNPQEVYRAVFGAVSHALEHYSLSPGVTGPDTRALGFKTRRWGATPAVLAFDRSPNPERDLEQMSFHLNDSKNAYHGRSQQGPRLCPLAQVARSYIIAESEQGLVLIDQHAAHERVRYERLMSAAEKQKPMIQPLLTPLELELGLESLRLFEGNRHDFEALGFEIETFGGSTVLLRAVPSGLEQREPVRVFKEIFSDLHENEAARKVLPFRERLLTSVACHGAIKFGDLLTLQEMETLIRDMETTKNASHCPHGRPSMITFDFNRLEGLFKRKNF